MSKRFIDYYLEAVTKKSGGGGGYPEPTGTINITSNGTHNVKDKATANVNVPQPSLGQLNEVIKSNGAVDFDPSDYGYDGFDSVGITVNVPTGGGGAEIIIPDNSLSAYIEGEGDPMDAQSVVNWYDLFDPTAPFNCTFQGATPSIDDKVLIMGDVLSSIDYTTVVGRYAIWGVCDIYDGIAITFSGALGYSVVDEEMPMNATTITAENDTGVSVIDAYTNESGSQNIAVNILPGGGGGGSNIVTGSFTANANGGSAQEISIPYTGSGYIKRIMVWYDDTPLLPRSRKYSLYALFATKYNPQTPPQYSGANTDATGYADVVVGVTVALGSDTPSNPTTSGVFSNGKLSVMYNNVAAANNTNDTRFRIRSKNTLSFWVGTSGSYHGLIEGKKYSYAIEYA